MSGSLITKLVLLAALLLLIAYDILAVSLFGFSGTISVVVYRMATEYPVLPLATGVILGHFFWPITGIYEDGKKSK
jgi:hypothetical protein